MKSFLTATAILLSTAAAPALAQSGNASSGATTNSTSSGGQYTGGGIAGTSNGGGTAGTAATAKNSQKGPDHDSKSGAARAPAGTMNHGTNGTPRIHDGPSDGSQGAYRPKPPP